MNDVGREIKRRREEKNWSQAQLAVYAGSSQPTVNQIETGKRNPSTATLQKLADALGADIADFFPKVPSRSSTEAPEESEGERRAKAELLEAWREYLDLELKRSDELRKEIIGILELENDLQVERIFARGTEFTKNVARIAEIAERRFIPFKGGGRLSLEEANRLRARVKKLIILGDAFMTFINHVNEVADELEIKRAAEEMIEELGEELGISEVDAATKDV